MDKRSSGAKSALSNELTLTDRGSSGSDEWDDSRPPSEYNYSRPNYPYPKLRKQPPPAAYHRQPQEWAHSQRSLHDLQIDTETPPATPGMGTPLRSLTPSAAASATWLPEYPQSVNSAFSPSPVVCHPVSDISSHRITDLAALASDLKHQ